MYLYVTIYLQSYIRKQEIKLKYWFVFYKDIKPRFNSKKNLGQIFVLKGRFLVLF